MNLIQQHFTFLAMNGEAKYSNTIGQKRVRLEIFELPVEMKEITQEREVKNALNSDNVILDNQWYFDPITPER